MSSPTVRLAPKGAKSIYVEHGVWYDATTRNIHVTIPGAPDGGHWSHARHTRQFRVYRELLIAAGRWPADGAEPTEAPA